MGLAMRTLGSPPRAASSLLAVVVLAWSAGVALGLTSGVALDASLERGRAGNQLRVQDPHQYLVTNTMYQANHPKGIGELTLSFWYQQLLPLSYTQILTYEVDPTLVGDAAPYALYAYIYLTATLGADTLYSSDTSILDGGWHHFCSTWRTADGRQNWYVDGQLLAQPAVRVGSLLPTAGYWSVGKGRYAATQFLGDLDQLMIFPASIDEADRLAISNALVLQPASFWSGLAGKYDPTGVEAILYDFDQQTSTFDAAGRQLIVDRSGSGNTGTMFCTTKCYSETLALARTPAALANWTEIRVSAQQAQPIDYLVYLALTNSPSAYAATGVEILALPTDVQLLRVSTADASVAGSPLNVNDVLQLADMPSTLASANLLAIYARVSTSFLSTSRTSFTFRTHLATGDTRDSLIYIGANHAPSVEPPMINSTVDVELPLSVDEGTQINFLSLFQRFPSVDKYGADVDADTVSAWIVGLPYDGVLSQSDGTIITSASVDSPVQASVTLNFLAPAYATLRPATPLRMEFYISDGLERSAKTAFFVFTVNEVPHLPVALPANHTVAQNSWTLLTLQVDRTAIHADDFPDVLISTLPTYGKLYNLLPSGEPDLSHAIGDPMLIESNFISQWASSVQGWSSWYYDPTGLYNVTQLLGPPDVFPKCGDNGHAYAGLNSNSYEFVEFGYDLPVYVSGLNVFETFNPGHTLSIYAQHPTTGEYVVAWKNPAVAPAVPSTELKAKIASPVTCPTTFKTNRLRINLAPTGYNWVEIDAISTIGSQVTSRWIVSDAQHRVWYHAPDLHEGADEFGVTVNSCEYYQANRNVGVQEQMIGVNVTRINHAPVAAIVTDVLTDELGVARAITLVGSDPDPSDTVQSKFAFQVSTLPTRGRLGVTRINDITRADDLALLAPGAELIGVDGAGLLTAASLLALTILDHDQLVYYASAPCNYDEQEYLVDQFEYVAVDFGSPPMYSPPATVSVQIYCARLEPISSGIASAAKALAFLGLAFCLGLIGFLAYNRENPLIKASSIMFNAIALVGCMGLYLSLLPLVWSPVNDGWCMARWCLPCLSFTTLFGSVFAKTRRIHGIFTNKIFRDHIMSNFDVLKFVAALCAAIGTILILFCAIAPSRQTLFYSLDARHTVYSGCATNDVFRWLLLGSLFLMLIWGVVLAIRIRNVPSIFNEAVPLGVTIYNSLLFGCLGVGIDFALDNSQSAQVAARVFLLFIGTTVACGALFGTKVWQLFVLWDKARNPYNEETLALRKRLHAQFKRQAEKEGKSSRAANKIADAKLKAVTEQQASSGLSSDNSGGKGEGGRVTPVVPGSTGTAFRPLGGALSGGGGGTVGRASIIGTTGTVSPATGAISPRTSTTGTGKPGLRPPYPITALPRSVSPSPTGRKTPHSPGTTSSLHGGNSAHSALHLMPMHGRLKAPDTPTQASSAFDPTKIDFTTATPEEIAAYAAQLAEMAQRRTAEQQQPKPHHHHSHSHSHQQPLSPPPRLRSVPSPDAPVVPVVTPPVPDSPSAAGFGLSVGSSSPHSPTVGAVSHSSPMGAASPRCIRVHVSQDFAPLMAGISHAHFAGSPSAAATNQRRPATSDAEAT